MITIYDILLLFAIILALGLLLTLIVIHSIREKQKKLSEQIFGEPKAKVKKKSPNAILGFLNNFSKAFFKLFKVIEKIIPYPQGEAQKKIEHDLELASKPFDLDSKGFMKLKVFCAIAFFFILFIIAAGNNNTTYYYYALGFALAGYFYPNFFLSNILLVRKQKISKEIPDAMDFISLCLAAGMNFQLAIEEYIKRNNNILSDEFSIFSNELQVGIQRIDAFQHMLERNESPELKNFLSSVIQSERLGTPLRPVITNQAIELRGKRKQTVEKAIASAPVKMLFPLILFILPAMLMMVLGSVLLPSTQGTKGITFTTHNFYFYQVTPTVRVVVNGVETPLIHIKKIENSDKTSFSILTDVGNLTSFDQEEYMMNFFIENSNLDDAWFVRIDLPENVQVVLKINIISLNKPSVTKTQFVILRYIHFEVIQLKKDITDYTNWTITLNGILSPDVRLDTELNGKRIVLKKRDKNTGEFYYDSEKLISGTNTVKFILTEKSGLNYEIVKYIIYRGIDVSASFGEGETTLKDTVKLVGIATPGCKVIIKKYNDSTKIFDTIQKIDIGENRNFEVDLPLNVGTNSFWLYAEKDGSEGPRQVVRITRKLSE